MPGIGRQDECTFTEETQYQKVGQRKCFWEKKTEKKYVIICRHYWVRKVDSKKSIEELSPFDIMLFSQKIGYKRHRKEGS